MERRGKEKSGLVIVAHFRISRACRAQRVTETGALGITTPLNVIMRGTVGDVALSLKQFGA